ncbi:heme lyase CcmF/NrfE family subunit [Limnochorda pilosa]|uniref:Cytochrome C biogenesis protein n=1 Tax=Limnochorda pilosa TaxID=1555112 RepID=A0A0K2SQ52_LIMPI|nr:heme lyase CcmF/NrfE family subunit [Limnochorda pilosa]BAS29253.1 cytochrome C biogenesis protein [Limnochorda pilosa]
MEALGRFSLIFAFVFSLYGLAAFVLGTRSRQERLVRSGRNAVAATALFLTAATAVLLTALIQSDFRFAYVVRYTTTDLSLLYKVSALWAGQEGSLLLWLWTLLLMSVAALYLPPGEKPHFVPYVGAVLLGVALFFEVLLLWVTPPFETLARAPAEGMGLNPLLQNVGMIIHPPATYLGYVGFTAPFAYAMAALITGETDDAWLRFTRRWTLAAWLFLSVGIIYGMQWAYVELGWGGFWGWDPVENASLMPWLTGTAFFHSAMIQEKRGMMKLWNVILIIVTFLLTLFGTFLTRSGVLSSVHAFSVDNLGPFFLGFIALVAAGSLGLTFARRHLLKEERTLEAPVSRESSFLFNNLLLVGGTFAVFWGTVFPIVSEAVRGVRVTVGPPFYEEVMGPIGVALIALMGACPLLAWRRSSLRNLRRSFLGPVVASGAAAAAFYLWLGVSQWGLLVAFTVMAFGLASIVQELVRGTRARMHLSGDGLVLSFFRLVHRNHRRYGGYLVHLGTLVLLAGVTAATAYQQSLEIAMKAGDMAMLGPYQVHFTGLRERRDSAGKATVYTDMVVSRGGDRLGILRPEKVFWDTFEQPTTEPAILGSWREDFYVILNGWEGAEQASFKLIVNPMVSWIWWGFYLLIAGTVFAVWPNAAEWREALAERRERGAFLEGSAGR